MKVQLLSCDAESWGTNPESDRTIVKRRTVKDYAKYCALCCSEMLRLDQVGLTRHACVIVMDLSVNLDDVVILLNNSSPATYVRGGRD